MYEVQKAFEDQKEDFKKYVSKMCLTYSLQRRRAMSNQRIGTERKRHFDSRQFDQIFNLFVAAGAAQETR